MAFDKQQIITTKFLLIEGNVNLFDGHSPMLVTAISNTHERIGTVYSPQQLAGNLHVYFRREDTPEWSSYKSLNKHL